MKPSSHIAANNKKKSCVKSVVGFSIAKTKGNTDITVLRAKIKMEAVSES